jgi:hypothetical protein
LAFLELLGVAYFQCPAKTFGGLDVMKSSYGAGGGKRLAWINGCPSRRLMGASFLSYALLFAD